MQFKIIVFLSPDIWNFGLFKARIPAFLCNLYSFQSNVINIQSKQLGTVQGSYNEKNEKKWKKTMLFWVPEYSFLVLFKEENR